MNNGKGKFAPMEKDGKRMRFRKETFGRILKYMFRYKLSLVAVAVCIIINAICGVAGGLFLRRLIDDYVTPLIGSPDPDFLPMLRAVLALAALYVAGIAAIFLYNRIMVRVAQGVLKKIRDEMFSHMQTLPVRYFDTNTFGDVMSHYTNDADTMRQLISQTIPQTFSSLVSILAAFVAMLATSIPLTLIIITTVTVVMIVSRKIASKSGRHFIGQQRSLGEVNGFVEEMITGQKVVKVFCHEDEAKRDFKEKNDRLCRDATAANKYANILMPVMGNLGHLQYVILAVAGGAIAVARLPGIFALSLGTVASFLQLSKGFTNPINQVSNQINAFIMALAGAERVFELMDEKPEEDGGYVTLVNSVTDADGNITETAERTGSWAWRHPHGDGTVTYTPLKGKVEFFDVDFGYNEEKIVLHNITMYAEPGQKVAFVGATGAGKTTITNLINRFYDIADGKIRYDGININKIKKADLRHSLGIVLQDVNLFTGTVMDNIRYGKLDATDEECIAAAKLAGADGFIRMLPDGYNTVLSGDGSGLSQGQRQLISIARAAVEDPPVMILDEATSSIDTRTEAIVQRGMDALMNGRTVFVIAHRLSTVQNSDVIMVLDFGRIIERGSHKSLIEEKGRYYQLYTGAFELE